MDGDLRLARILESSFVLSVNIETERIAVSGKTQPASEVGGDYIDCIIHPNGALLVIADVAGHGIGTIAVVGMLKSAIRTLGMTHTDLPHILPILNAMFRENTSKNIFISVSILHVDSVGEKATVAIAGHLPVLHYEYENQTVKEIHGNSTAIGITEKPMFFVTDISVRAGDRLLLVTDELTEGINDKNEEYGFGRIKQLFQENGSLHASEINHLIINDFEQYRKKKDDDYSLLCAELQ